VTSLLGQCFCGVHPQCQELCIWLLPLLLLLQVVKAMMVFWTAGFVLLTLLINAPLLPVVLRLTGLSKVKIRM
jgi:hypothetical protein